MKKDTLLGIALNMIFVLSIFTIRYYYAKQEMDFLVKDSERQEQLISDNESSIDSLSAVTRRLQIDNDTNSVSSFLGSAGDHLWLGTSTKKIFYRFV